jgi:transcriptional regulator with XRE-family HTH domain
MPKLNNAKHRFVTGSSRGTRSAHTLLLQMAKDAEKLAAQAERINKLRAAKRVTQPEVADAVGVSLRAYQAWESGASGLNPQNIKALAGYYGTTPDYIEYGDERNPPPGFTDEVARRELAAQLDRIEDSINALVERLVAAGVLQAIESRENA